MNKDINAQNHIKKKFNFRYFFYEIRANLNHFIFYFAFLLAIIYFNIHDITSTIFLLSIFTVAVGIVDGFVSANQLSSSKAIDLYYSLPQSPASIVKIKVLVRILMFLISYITIISLLSSYNFSVFKDDSWNIGNEIMLYNFRTKVQLLIITIFYYLFSFSSALLTSTLFGNIQARIIGFIFIFNIFTFGVIIQDRWVSSPTVFILRMSPLLSGGRIFQDINMHPIKIIKEGSILLLVVSIIYFLVAFYLSKKIKRERVGKCLFNRKLINLMQIYFSIVLGLILFAIEFLKQSNNDLYLIQAFINMSIVFVLVFIIFNLIKYRTIKKIFAGIPRALISFCILVVIACIYFSAFRYLYSF